MNFECPKGRTNCNMCDEKDECPVLWDITPSGDDKECQGDEAMCDKYETCEECPAYHPQNIGQTATYHAGVSLFIPQSAISHKVPADYNVA